ncbi:MAG TPA: hypothetical protein VJT09_00990 [Pyrinomonadaceae bacterium]|nr:hypothetical protein [Pyrinomonadaceae bacterium]
MEHEVHEIEDWLKRVADVLYLRIHRQLPSLRSDASTPDFELHLVEPETIAGDLGRFDVNNNGQEAVRVIQISCKLLDELLKTEASGHGSFIYQTVLPKAQHIRKMCGCEEETLCNAWVVLLDTLEHEALHLFCYEEYGLVEEDGGHSTDFLKHALKLGLDLKGTFHKWPETRFKVGWNPAWVPFEDFYRGKVVEGHIKSYYSPRGSGLVERMITGTPVDELEEMAGEITEVMPVEDDNFAELYLYGVGATG